MKFSLLKPQRFLGEFDPECVSGLSNRSTPTHRRKEMMDWRNHDDLKRFWDIQLKQVEARDFVETVPFSKRMRWPLAVKCFRRLRGMTL